MTDNSSSNSTIGLPVCIMRILNHPFNCCVVLSHLKFKKKEDKADMTSFKIAHLRARKGREKSVIFLYKLFPFLFISIYRSTCEVRWCIIAWWYYHLSGLLPVNIPEVGCNLFQTTAFDSNFDSLRVYQCRYF